MDNVENMGTEELNELHSKAESLKNDTQEFVSLARKLSDEGVKDAKKLLDFAKTNWKTILGTAIALGAGGAALTTATRSGKGKGKATSKKTSAKDTTAKFAAGAKATTKKVAKKAAKKVSKKASKKRLKKLSRVFYHQPLEFGTVAAFGRRFHLGIAVCQLKESVVSPRLDL